MTYMGEVFGEPWWGKFVDEQAVGNITLRQHPDKESLVIANYTPKAAYESAWNDVTLASRGLIFDYFTGQILARPFKKFFNYGQAGAPTIDLDQEVRAANKYDGSLGIIYRAPDGKLAVATRGSFQSEQAQHATALLRKKYNEDDYAQYETDIEDGYTPLVEIIYPENRIVLDYGDKDYLQRLGWVFIESGAFFTAQSERVTFGELLARAPRPNAEGYVVWLDLFTAVKIKQEDYVALHAVVTNLSEKKVWEVIKQDDPQKWDEFVAALPDELHGWTNQVAGDIQHAVADYERYLYREYDKIVDMAWDGQAMMSEQLLPRKDFAIAVQKWARPEDRPFMFSILDGKSVIPKLFDKYKPEGLGSRPTNVLRIMEDA